MRAKLTASTRAAIAAEARHAARSKSLDVALATNPNSKLLMESMSADVLRIFDRLSDSRLPTASGRTPSGFAFANTSTQTTETASTSTTATRAASASKLPSPRQMTSPAATAAETNRGVDLCGRTQTKQNQRDASAAVPMAVAA